MWYKESLNWFVLLTYVCLLEEDKDGLRSKLMKDIYKLYRSNPFNEITKQRSAVNG